MKLKDLNYQHLLYFYTVATEGSVLRASKALNLAPSTVSAQIKTLEEELGQALFQRSGRNLVLTSFGEIVREYSEQIFDLGEELIRAVQGAVRRPVRVGVSSVLPKLLVRELLLPGLLPEVQLIIHESGAEDLLGALAARRLDVVLTDAEMPSWMTMRGVSHAIIETHVAVFGAPALAERVGARLPEGLADVPWLVPPPGTALRQGLEAWWAEVGIEPDIAAVIDDSALLKALADEGAGVFAAPQRMTQAILDGYRVRCIGVTQRITERAFAITADEDPPEPAVRAICRLDEREGDRRTG